SAARRDGGGVTPRAARTHRRTVPVRASGGGGAGLAHRPRLGRLAVSLARRRRVAPRPGEGASERPLDARVVPRRRERAAAPLALLLVSFVQGEPAVLPGRSRGRHVIALPIDDVMPEILAALRATRTLVLEAPPGAGKTTRVPPAMLDEAGLIAGGEIVVLQPRRLA